MTLFDENGNVEHGAIVAADAANGLFRHLWDDAIRRAAATPGGSFTADELQTAYNLPDIGPATGGCFQAAAKAGVIRKIGYRPSTKPSRAGSILTIWTGTGAAHHREAA